MVIETKKPYVVFSNWIQFRKHRASTFLELLSSCIQAFFIVLLTRLANLFNGLPKSERCWSGRSYKLCDDLILTVGAYHTKGLDSGSFDVDPSCLILDISDHPEVLL